MKKIWFFLHGVVLAIGCPLVLYGHAIPGMEFAPITLIQPALLFLGLYAVICGIAFLILRNASASALIASVVILGLLYQWLIFVVILSAVLLGVSALYFRRKTISFGDVHLLLSVISVLVIGYFAFQFVGVVQAFPWASYRSMTSEIVNALDTPSDFRQKPDVYYIILDGYARADVLKTLYGYDNSSFTHALEERGFVIASESRSNYPRTSLSVASSLNMQYLDSMSETMGESSLLWPLNDIIKHSTVRTIFEKNGYQTIFFADDWEYSDIRDGDVYVKPSLFIPNGFTEAIIGNTNLKIVSSILPASFVSLPDYDSHRRFILNDFEELPKVANLSGPKFIYAHIVAPHPPFVFNQEGEPINPSYGFTLNDAQNLFGDTAHYTQGYLDQLSFVNQQTLAMIDGILANSETPPIILIQADHGPAIQHHYFTVEELSTFERYSILNAYYLPGVDPGEIPQDITPVNSFRFVFDQYFGAHYELLPNRQYFPTGMVLYQFQDVTDKVP